MSLAEAWAKFEKAEKFDAKVQDSTKDEKTKRIAAKGVDKYLDEAVALEEQAIAAGERH